MRVSVSPLPTVLHQEDQCARAVRPTLCLLILCLLDVGQNVQLSSELTGGALDDFTEEQQLGILHFLAKPQSHEISPQ